MHFVISLQETSVGEIVTMKQLQNELLFTSIYSISDASFLPS